jgi:methionyl aminopeptidase
MQYSIISFKDFSYMDAAGKLASKTLDMITEHVKAGISTNELNNICHEFILANGAFPAPLNYNGFPKSVCTSVNNVACHGIPCETAILKDGDTLNIDVTVILDGWYGDTSRMFKIGQVNEQYENLMKAAYDVMWEGIRFVKAGMWTGELAKHIEIYVKKKGYSIVHEFCGHGIGRIFHADPVIYYFDDGRKGELIKEGMVFTMEPIIKIGSRHIYMETNGQEVKSYDKHRAAQFEHTLIITKDSKIVLTLSPEERKTHSKYSMETYLLEKKK